MCFRIAWAITYRGPGRLCLQVTRFSSGAQLDLRDHGSPLASWNVLHRSFDVSYVGTTSFSLHHTHCAESWTPASVRW
jgi:hypothetical protein